MDNFFNFDNMAYNTVDVNARSDFTNTNIYLANERVSLDTRCLALTDGGCVHG